MGVAPTSIYWGMTVRSPLDVVYTVKDVKGIEFSPPLTKEQTDFLFWGANDQDAWGGRLLSGNKLKVTYRGNPEPKEFTYAELKEQRLIWQNWNPGVSDTDFYIEPLVYPFTKQGLKDNGAPHLEVYYRGGKIKQPIDVYTKLLSLSATAGDLTWNSEEIEEWLDNDVTIDPVGGEAGLAAQIVVEATYQAYNDTGLQKTIKLEPQLSTLVGGVVVPPVATLDGPYYTTTYYSVAPAITKDKSKAIKIEHRVDAGIVEAALGLAPNDLFNGGLALQRKSKNVAVKWIR